MSLLVAQAIELHREGRRLLDAASIRLESGQLHALLGANGAGKSSLLKALSGEWPIAAGEILLDGAPLRSYPPAQLARRRAVLPQQDALQFGFSVMELVTLGRSPARRGTATQERDLLEAVLQATDTNALAQRSYLTLSGGERRRAQLARVLAQVWDAPNAILLLDEPNHSLDLGHQHAMMRLLAGLTSQGFAIIASLHDPNLAAAYAQQTSLLSGGRVIASGPTAEVLDAQQLKRLYGDNLQFRSVALDGALHWLASHETI